MDKLARLPCQLNLISPPTVQVRPLLHGLLPRQPYLYKSIPRAYAVWASCFLLLVLLIHRSKGSALQTAIFVAQQLVPTTQGHLRCG